MHFPDIYGDDAERYLDWIWTRRQQAGGDSARASARRATSTARRRRRSPSQRTAEGVNIAGYFRAELGIGEAARQLTSAIEAAGIPHATTTYDATLSRQSHPFAERASRRRAYDINVLCVNADSTPRFARDVGPEFFAGRHTVGYWFWEVEQFPETMHAAFDVVDEVWTATDFIARRGARSRREAGVHDSASRAGAAVLPHDHARARSG